MNDGAVYRTAPATPGPLIINTRQAQRLHKYVFSAENELSEDEVGPG